MVRHGPTDDERTVGLGLWLVGLLGFEKHRGNAMNRRSGSASAPVGNCDEPIELPRFIHWPRVKTRES